MVIVGGEECFNDEEREDICKMNGKVRESNKIKIGNVVINKVFSFLDISLILELLYFVYFSFWNGSLLKMVCMVDRGFLFWVSFRNIVY